ncbi:MAG TPA: hypothetical protein PKD54_12105, partial [Pirellulaceae bacterium]|nr:hypothetical protein [Pirellulaceae bacterium]
MLKPTDELLIFGIIVILVSSWAIVVPYLRRRNDLMTPTNFFLIGAVFFIGISAIDSAITPHMLINAFDFTALDYRLYMLHVGVFFAAFWLGNQRCRRSVSSVANRMFMRWPPIRQDVLTFMIFMACLFSLGVVFRPPIIGVAQALHQLATKATAIAIVVAFVAWHRDRQNPIWMTSLVGCVFLAILMGILSGGGRRTILSSLVALPLAWYWVVGRVRYRPLTVVTWISLAAVTLFFLLGAYSVLRRSDRATSRGDRSLEFGWTVLTKIPERFGEVPWGQMLGQRSVECSLAARRVYIDQPYDNLFHSIKFIAYSPIPRALFRDRRDKPEGLGKHLPRDIRARTRATWGPGIIGHGYYEGGWPVLLLYGFLAGWFFQLLDVIVQRNSQNPFVLGIVAAISSNVIGWLRGDIATFTIQIMAGIMAGLLLAYMGRVLYGSTQYHSLDY